MFGQKTIASLKKENEELKTLVESWKNEAGRKEGVIKFQKTQIDYLNKKVETYKPVQGQGGRFIKKKLNA